MDAIVIVDLQKAFSIPPSLVETIERRSREFPRRIFTQFMNPPDSLMRTKLQRNSCQPEREETALRLEPTPRDLVLVKTGYGLTTDQVSQLKNDGIRKVLVCGADTDACVLGVLFSLFDGGIDCSVEPELCWSCSGLHNEALKIISEQFGTPQDLEGKLPDGQHGCG